MKKEYKELVNDLKDLNQAYLEILKKRKDFPDNKTDVEESRQFLKESGQKIINFYNKIFIPKYSKKDDEKSREVGRDLGFYASLAKTSIENNQYFCLAVLLTNKGDKTGDPNNLEKMIADLKK